MNLKQLITHVPLPIDRRGRALVRATDDKHEGRGNRLYQLIRRDGHITDRRLAIVVLDRGIAVMCFTFG